MDLSSMIKKMSKSDQKIHNCPILAEPKTVLYARYPYSTPSVYQVWRKSIQALSLNWRNHSGWKDRQILVSPYTLWMTPRSYWERTSGSPERSEKPFTSTRDPLPSSETEATRSLYFANSCHVILRSCDLPFKP